MIVRQPRLRRKVESLPRIVAKRGSCGSLAFCEEAAPP
jgi:hypothetical protein